MKLKFDKIQLGILKLNVRKNRNDLGKLQFMKEFTETEIHRSDTTYYTPKEKKNMQDLLDYINSFLKKGDKVCQDSSQRS